MAPGAIYLGGDRPPPPSIAKLRMKGAVPFPPYVYIVWCFIKFRENISLAFSFIILGLK
jgi:hypothetical protein